TRRSLPSSNFRITLSPIAVAETTHRPVVMSAPSRRGLSQAAPAGRTERCARRFWILQGNRRKQFGLATRWLTPAGPTSGGAYRSFATGLQVCNQGWRQSQWTIGARTI